LLNHAKQFGFSLIELMVVVAISLILLLIASASIQGMLDRARVRGAADDLVSLIASTRSGAANLNLDVNLHVAGTAPLWCVGANAAVLPGTLGNAVPAAANCDCTTASNCTVGNQQLVVDSSQYSGVTMTGRPASDTIISGRLGTINNLTPSSFTLTSPLGKYQMRVNIAPLGMASICTPIGQPLIPGYASC
jgi:type IV fimbrial biogenesis protein FimT